MKYTYFYLNVTNILLIHFSNVAFNSARHAMNTRFNALRDKWIGSDIDTSPIFWVKTFSAGICLSLTFDTSTIFNWLDIRRLGWSKMGGDVSAGQKPIHRLRGMAELIGLQKKIIESSFASIRCLNGRDHRLGLLNIAAGSCCFPRSARDQDFCLKLLESRKSGTFLLIDVEQKQIGLSMLSKWNHD